MNVIVEAVKSTRRIKVGRIRLFIPTSVSASKYLAVVKFVRSELFERVEGICKTSPVESMSIKMSIVETGERKREFAFAGVVISPCPKLSTKKDTIYRTYNQSLTPRSGSKREIKVGA